MVPINLFARNMAASHQESVELLASPLKKRPVSDKGGSVFRYLTALFGILFRKSS